MRSPTFYPTLVVLIFLLSASMEKANAALDLSEYDLVFSDEFDTEIGDSVIDPTKWNTRFYWGPYQSINAEEQQYVDILGLNSDSLYSPFSVSEDGILSIEAIESPGLTQPDLTNSIWASSPDLNYQDGYDPNLVNYLSGILTSSDTYNTTHGYFEARLKFPKGQGLWPAFWLLNTKYVENLPEIDIVEFLGHKPDTVHHTLHYIDSSNDWLTVSSPTFETTGTDFTADFHTYGLAWDPERIRFFVDGQMVKEVTENEFLISGQSMYMILNLAVGGSWPGTPNDQTTFPAKFEIDYVRAYERKSLPEITQQVLDEQYQLMFSDEFNDELLNEEIWNSSFLWGPYLQINNEEQLYIDKLGMHKDYPFSPFEVSAGSLKITAEAIEPNALPEMPDITDPVWKEYPSYRSESNYMQTDGWVPSYVSGILTSYDSFKFVNGYAEARIKMPVGSGLWPAFWMLNGYYVGPMPEMDIVEVKGGEPFTTHHSYHYSDEVGQIVSSADVYSLPGSSIDEYHVYGFQWDSERMVWYVDGVAVREYTGENVSTQLSYLLLNLAVGGDFVGAVSNDVLPAHMEIDWIRVWQLQSSPETSSEGLEYSVGNVGLGVAVDDGATGQGYLMYSQENVFTRFAAQSAPYAGNADHFIAVRLVDGSWQYNDNSVIWREFVPAEGDRLLARLDFDADTVESLEGQEGLYSGLRWGYAGGDLLITANRWLGIANKGEFGVSGSGFNVNAVESNEEIIVVVEPTDNWTSTGYLGSGLGVAVDDGATGQGYLMYSQENVFTRFAEQSAPYAGNADHFIAVRLVDGSWQYNDNSVIWREFVPAEGDRLLARLDFDADTVESLEGQEGLYSGLRWGYAGGDLLITANRWLGIANKGEFGVSGSGFNVNAVESNEEIIVVVEPTDNWTSTGYLGSGLGVAVDDGATGQGYLMYSQENVFTRFAEQSAPYAGNADHFIAVRLVDGSWQYNDNSVIWREFVPAEGDRLLARLDFDADTVESLEGQEGLYSGLRWGYAGGDLLITANRWLGIANKGEFGVSGSGFNVNAVESNEEIIVVVEPTDNWTSTGYLGSGLGVAVDDGATGQGYLMYSQENVFTRFAEQSAPYAGNADHFIAVRLVDGSWQYNDNSVIWREFVPAEGDRLLARLDFDADTVESLEGQEGLYSGLRWGYAGGDLLITANRWLGIANKGEFGVSGSGFNVNAVESNEEIIVVVEPTDNWTSTGYLGSGLGVAVDDGATGQGYLMYSQENVFTRFAEQSAPYAGNADHFIAVRLVDGSWQYNDNSVIWREFVPAEGDRLLARLDFDADTVESLEGQEGLYSGLRWGYAGGDLLITANRWLGIANKGEFGVSGSGFNVNAVESNEEIVIGG